MGTELLGLPSPAAIAREAGILAKIREAAVVGLASDELLEETGWGSESVRALGWERDYDARCWRRPM